MFRKFLYPTPVVICLMDGNSLNNPFKWSIFDRLRLIVFKSVFDNNIFKCSYSLYRKNKPHLLFLAIQIRTVGFDKKMFA